MTTATTAQASAASGRHAGSFVDQIKIRREPRGQLGRFFLSAESRLADDGLIVQKSDFQTLLDVHLTNKSSWRALAECFDPRLRVIDDERAACFVAYDAAGTAIGSVAVVREDLGAHTVRDRFEDLSFWYGENANAWRDTITCRVPAAGAGRLTGSVYYPGAFWVHPSRRGEGFGYILPEIARFYALSQWDCDYEIGIASYALRRPDIQRYSHFQHHEENFVLSGPHGVMYEGLFLWSHLDFVYARLERHARQGLQADGLVNKIGDQQPRAANG